MLKEMTVHHDGGSYSFFIEFMLHNWFLIIFDATVRFVCLFVEQQSAMRTESKSFTVWW